MTDPRIMRSWRVTEYDSTINGGLTFEVTGPFARLFYCTFDTDGTFTVSAPFEPQPNNVQSEIIRSVVATYLIYNMHPEVSR